MKRVAIQGISGSFHHMAAMGYFGYETYKTIECTSFNLLFDKLKYGEADYAIVAIENNKKNFTRFLIISNETNYNHYFNEQVVNKTSICFKLPHEQGSLSQALSVLAYYKMNLSKIQSLPIVGEEWHYLFYVDLVYSDYNRYRLALEAIKPLTDELQILGEYQRSVQPVKNITA